MATFLLDGEVVFTVSGDLVGVVGPVQLFSGTNHYHKLAIHLNSENHGILGWLELEQTLKLT